MKIIMCDDEPWALKGIRNIIEWEKYGFTSVKTFLRSGEAWQEILTGAPDVVITDIRMPGMSGLELLEKAKTYKLECLFVIVSAYAEFEYAQRALEGQAFAYVLKPFDKEKLEELAQRLRREVTQKYCQALNPLMLRETMHILSGDAGKKPAEARTFNPWFEGPYRLCAATAVPHETEHVWFSVYDDLHLAVLSEQEAQEVTEACGLSRAGEGGILEPEKISQALTALYSLRFYGDSRPCPYKESGLPEQQILENMCAAVKKGDAAAMRGCIDLYEACVRDRKPMVDSITVFYNRLLDILQENLPRQALPQDLHGFTNCFQMCNLFYSVDFFFENIRVLPEHLLDFHGKTEDSGSLIGRIVQYVDGHYKEHLSLELLASRFNLSLSHLSRQFKTETGTSFSKYLTAKRIAYAAYLLEYTQLSMTEISEMTGWQDVFYFSKVFKKSCGVSPMGYRKEKQRE